MAYVVASSCCCHCAKCWDLADVPHGTLRVVFTVRERGDDGFESHVIQQGFASKAAAEEAFRAHQESAKVVEAKRGMT